MTSAIVRGVDGCGAGWLTISVDTNGGQPTSSVFRDANALFESDDWAVTAIDIPIGLPSKGPRDCDVQPADFWGTGGAAYFRLR